MERMLGVASPETGDCIQISRGKPKEVTSKDDMKSTRGSFADLQEGQGHRRGESAYDRQRATSIQQDKAFDVAPPPRGRETAVEQEKERIRDVSLSSSPSVASGGKRKSWGSPRRFLERMKTKQSWGLTTRVGRAWGENERDLR